MIDVSARDQTDRASVLRELAEAVRRLGPDRHNPEHFHIEKDRIAAEITRLAKESEARML